jgi:hypothetical protein
MSIPIKISENLNFFNFRLKKVFRVNDNQTHTFLDILYDKIQNSKTKVIYFSKRMKTAGYYCSYNRNFNF